MTLKELLEGVGPRTLLHYTDYHALKKILDTGKLEAFEYPGTKSNTKQIATVRPSMANKDNVKQLSSGTRGGVKIIIDASKMSDSARGAKIKTVAEFPIIHKQEIKKKLNVSDRKLELVLKELDKHYKRFGETEDDLVSDEAVKNLKMIEKKLGLTRLKSAIASYELYLERRINREGEERITVKHPKSSIPVNNKYIKIELMDPYEGKAFSSRVGAQKTIKKNKGLFVDNKHLKDILSPNFIKGK